MHNGIAKEARKIEANTLLRRDAWKRFSEYGFRDTCIKAEMQLQNAY